MHFGCFLLAFVGYVTTVCVAHTVGEVQSAPAACRKPPNPRPRDMVGQQRQQADSDGITREYGTCRTRDNFICDICCNGRCCEYLSQSIPRFPPQTQMWIPVRFILILGASEQQAAPPIEQRELDYQLGVLNQGFENTSFRFHQHSFEVFRDNRMKSSCNTDPCYISDGCDFYTYTMPRVRVDSSEVVNVVVCDIPAYFGEAQWPWATVENHNHQYIEISFQAFADRGTYAGTTWGHGKTLVHEMGHYLGLLHIFEKQGYCDADGDFVADTPSSQTAANQAQECSLVTDSCTGDNLPDDRANYMNYARDECMEHFSAGQIERMEKTMTQYRPLLRSRRLVHGYCPANHTNLTQCTCHDTEFNASDFCGSHLIPVTPTTSGVSVVASSSWSVMAVVVVVMMINVVAR